MRGMWASLLATVLLAVGHVAAYAFPDCSSAPLSGNAVCDITLDPITRARAIIDQFTVPELINNTVNTSPGVPRLGLPAYQWWSEALHGVAISPGVNFSTSGEFSYATSFPQPIVMSAAFDDPLILAVATVVSTEARAFNNVGRAGLDYWTPNINPFKDPRWGRGQETPGEDPYHVAQYVYNLIQGLQGGLDPEPYFRIAATCKHFAGYDLEDWNGYVRYGFNAVITEQDMSEYYFPSFQSCVRDAKVASVMCSYNAVNGIPSCANTYLLQNVLREFWGLTEDRWVTSDCDAVDNIYSPHNYTATLAEAVADAMNAGTDIDCGSVYAEALPDAYAQGLVSETQLYNALVRQYASLVRLGYFDPAAIQPYRQYGWSQVNTPEAQTLAYTAAVEGITLLKNDGTLPLNSSVKNIALIGPWANATTAMQGNYQGVAPYLISPLMAAQTAGYNVTYVFGTNITSNDTSGFAAAVAAAEAADAVIYAGGIDETVEREEVDRYNITWPGNQLDLIAELQQVGKPFVVVQFGGGQVDDTVLKNNATVNALVWAGYPGQSGGTALFDILSGKVAPAGRLTTTQYPADYVNQVAMTDMTLRPSATNPGRTYKWYTGAPVYEFGTGLHYTTFELSWLVAPSGTYSIQTLVQEASRLSPYLDSAPFGTFNVLVRNAGTVTSDYVTLLFLNGTYGPAPYPNKQLVSYTRLHAIPASYGLSVASLPVTLGSLARADNYGNLWVYPGNYTFTVDTPGLITSSFELTGTATQITNFPQESGAPTR
ncbi:beta-xylosidase [Gloeophyllum trabeum ATCC 11539]|uniref:xylan 1,4-beta-xylosidase n=1 Tax=Gloeophyllum trabeum (strain ATCC 11539 / FP-39264 / Madison 617) TaxID=670483 RepID=S7RIM9_GLOTA|nr:beta-xylosidase [Gloeophyllum trabeum ATCC 11539]EPQ54190.1 beta-xylosidase [Gloeophyllum trabeum ATCC 11539]